jgi:hypothetical protein
MKLPLCAWCGGETTERARLKRKDSLFIGMDHPHEPHRPRYAWHGDCAEADPLADGLFKRPRTLPLDELIAGIEARGPGRIVRRRRP